MSRIARSPITASRPIARGRSIVLALLVFGLTAGSMYWYVGAGQKEPAAPPSFTATAYVVQRATKLGAPETRIPLSYTFASAGRAKKVANTLADCYADERRVEWQRHTDEARRRLADDARLTREQLEQDEARLAAFRKQMQVAKAMAHKPRQPQTVDNPQWIELQHRLDELDRQRAKLLVDRTPLHPAVRDVTAEMSVVKRQMSAVPRKLTVAAEQAPSPPPEWPTEQDKQRLAELTAAVETDRQKCDEAAAKVSFAEVPSDPYSVIRAGVVADPPRFESRTAGRWVPLLAGVLMAWGVGFVSLGSSIRPVSGSVGQVRADAGVPVLGEIPANDPVANPRGLFDRQCATRRNLVGLGLLLIATCPLAIVWGLTAFYMK